MICSSLQPESSHIGGLFFCLFICFLTLGDARLTEFDLGFTHDKKEANVAASLPTSAFHKALESTFLNLS